MGKTYKRNDRWKRDRRDQGFKKSKKFKEFAQGGFSAPKHSPTDIKAEPEIVDADDSTDS